MACGMHAPRAMLERYVSDPRHVEVDHIDVGVSPAAAYEVARHFDIGRSAMVRVLFKLRALPDLVRGRASSHEPRHTLDDLGAAGEGFRLLHDEPGRGFAFGAIGRFWQASIELAEVAAERFSAFDEPGYGKVAWGLRFEPLGDAATRIVLELYMGATDERAWQALRKYYRRIRPASHFIRVHLLKMLAADLGSAEAGEQTRELPFDDLVPKPRVQVTQGVTIFAPREAVWPWLVQMGCGRAGWYGIDVLDNGGEPSEREIVPELQHVRVGDVLPAEPGNEAGFEVLHVAPDHALVLGALYDLDRDTTMPFESVPPTHYWRAIWIFYLQPYGEATTRLTVRARVDFSESPQQATWMVPVHHFMERAQLGHLKQRAEGHPVQAWSDVADGMVGSIGFMVNVLTPFLRTTRAHWGLDEALVDRAYPGDEIVPEPRWSWTHGIEIDAPAEEVWPWIAQIGQGKAGFYSYQWMENLAGSEIQNARHLHPDWGAIQLGGELRLHPKMPPLEIVALEKGRFFVAQGGRPPVARPNDVIVSWLFQLEPLEGNRCRLISRFRTAYGDELVTRLSYGPVVTESLGFVMDRRMLLGIKHRVEHGRADRSSHRPTQRPSGAEPS